jgi:hypothetical protein
MEKRFVYILRSITHPDRHYVGLTSDVAERLSWHNNGPSGVTLHNEESSGCSGKLLEMSTMNKRPLIRSPWAWRLWMVACLLFLWAGLQQPTKRGIYFSVAVVFGIFAARQRP